MCFLRTPNPPILAAPRAGRATLRKRPVPLEPLGLPAVLRHPFLARPNQIGRRARGSSQTWCFRWRWLLTPIRRARNRNRPSRTARLSFLSSRCGDSSMANMQDRAQLGQAVSLVADQIEIAQRINRIVTASVRLFQLSRPTLRLDGELGTVVHPLRRGGGATKRDSSPWFLGLPFLCGQRPRCM